MTESIFLAKVVKQRDNGPDKSDVRGQWVAKYGCTTDVTRAQVFRSEKEIKGHIPLLWEYEVFEFKAALALRIEKADYHAYNVERSKGESPKE